MPFYVSLLVDDLLLHNYMLDSGASSNEITRKVMEQLNLRITRPYHNVCAMDAREVEVVGIILNLHVKLAKYPDIDMEMDAVVINVPDNWGMLLSKKWAATLGRHIQMDWTYAIIPASENTRVILHREKERQRHVENPKKPANEFVHYTDNFGNYAILSNFMAHIKHNINNEKVDGVWKIYFDEAYSKDGKCVGIIIIFPSKKTYNFAFRLEFEA